MYGNGRGVSQDFGEAIKWYKKAADQGNAWGQYYLGWAYANGQGVGQDDDAAVKWYSKAADQNNAHAQYQLGLMAESGRGTKRSFKTALHWHNLAAEQGLAEARRRHVILRLPQSIDLFLQKSWKETKSCFLTYPTVLEKEMLQHLGQHGVVLTLAPYNDNSVRSDPLTQETIYHRHTVHLDVTRKNLIPMVESLAIEAVMQGQRHEGRLNDGTVTMEWPIDYT